MACCHGEMELEHPPVSLRGRAIDSLDTRIKIGFVAIALIANLVSPSPWTPALFGLFSLAGLLVLGIPAKTIVKRMAIPWYIGAVAALTQLFLVGHTPLFHVWQLTGYQEGLARGALILARVWGGTALVLGLSLTTPLTELLETAAWLRVPPVLVELTALIYRYLFLFSEEAARIKDAQTVRLGHTTWWRSIQCYGTLIGMVIVRSYDRAESVYAAMMMRGYTGNIPTKESRSFRRHDWQHAALAVALLGIIASVGWV